MNIKSQLFRTAFWIKDFFKGKPIGSHYTELKSETKNPAKTENLKQKRLNELLFYATKNCEFYKDYSGKELKDFPIVNKKILIDNVDKIKVFEGKNPYQAADKKYHIQKTSGSTGTPFAIPQDTRKRNRRIAELKYFGEIVGFKSHESLVHLRTWTRWQSKSKKQAFCENIWPFDISNMGDEHLAELVQLMKQKKAVALRGYASSFDLLCDYVQNHPQNFPHLKIVIAGSETLYDTTREKVKNILKCNIISQYANEENGILAQEKIDGESGHFYINQAGYVFEVLKMNSDETADFGELGRVVLTDLFNYAFPVIRYDNGDTAILKKDEQTGEVYISALYGRRLDIVYDTKNEPVFPMAFARTLKNFDGIKQWQFIQEYRGGV